MYPLIEQTLSLHDIAEHWSRCMPQRVDKQELINVLCHALWRGKLEVGNASTGEPLRRAALAIMRAEPSPSPRSRGIVFYQREDELPPDFVEHGDRFELVDYRHRIRLSADAVNWTEAEVDEACEALARLNYEDLPDIIQGPLLATPVHRDVFAAFCDQMGWERPAFWFAEPKPSARVRAKTAGRTGFRRLLRELVGRGQRLTKKQVRNMALERFQQLSVAEFNRVWAQTVPAEWKRPGRPNKQPKRLNSVR